MIDSIIIYFKNLPHVLNYSLKHVKNLWKWFTVSFIVGLVLIFAIEIFFKVTNATEMIQGVWLYRLLTLLGFGYIVLSLFLCYKIYAKDYMITKSFKISPVTPIVVTTIVGGILLFVLLISHAFLESGNGTSNFASGRYGIYNYFGIGAYDNNPNNAIPFARKRGWTTPAKGIMGGAKFVRQDFINKGQNTLYRMRWNPKHPATHQYATDINWCRHQASNIAYYYKKIGLKGMYYIRDKYR